MNTSMIFLLVIQLILIALNAIFASAEIAVLSTNETKLEKMAKDGNVRAKRLVKLTQEPARFLATIQVAITLSGFLGSAFAAENFSEPLVNWLVSLGIAIPRSTLETVSVIFITLILSYFTLVFGELVPKRIAMKKSEELAMGISGLITGISVFFKPLVSFLSISTNFVLKLFGIDPNEEEDEVTEEEIRMMVDAGSESGAIDHQEKEFIQNVFDFDDVTAGTIATHRADVTFLWMEDSIDDWDTLIHKTRHTLYPICGETQDDVLGILNTKDYFRQIEKTKNAVLASSVSEPYFVVETTKADVLFNNMKRLKKSIAIVLDEYGGMVGIVTLFDLLEEIVGSLHEVYPVTVEEPTLKKVSDRSWEVFGNIRLDDLEVALDLSLPKTACDTLTGIVFQNSKLIPKDGTVNLDVTFYKLHISIDQIREHQVAHGIIEVMAEE